MMMDQFIFCKIGLVKNVSVQQTLKHLLIDYKPVKDGFPSCRTFS